VVRAVVKTTVTVIADALGVNLDRDIEVSDADFRAIEADITRAREDPVGTIRRSPEGVADAAYAIKTAAGWVAVHSTGSREFAAPSSLLVAQLPSWPIVYRPEWDS
jgi:hypothetical protein